MKHYFFLFILSIGFLITSCSGQRGKAFGEAKKTLTKDSTCCFDIKNFSKKVGTSGDGPSEYDFMTADGREIRQIVFKPERESPPTEWSYTEEISKKRSPFIVIKKYDDKGRLRRWSTTFLNESINKSYEYDEYGKVTTITDNEESYKHSFADIREFLLREKGIDIYDTRQAIARRINHYNKINPEATYKIYVVVDLNDASKSYTIFINDMTLEMRE